MPSQKQVRWAEVRVGITVVVAFVALFVLILLMNANTGLFTKKIVVRGYFTNAQGLKEGAPVQLQGVSIGTVTKVRIVADEQHKDKPVEVMMKLGTKYSGDLYKNSVATLDTVGVLGDTFVDIDSHQASGNLLADGDVVPSKEKTGIVDTAQGAVQNLNVILKQVNEILAAIQNRQGTIGKIIYDPTLVNQASKTLTDLQKLVTEVSSGQGTVGKFITSDELYVKANGTVDRVNRLLDGIEQGKGTAGKFVKDPAMYNNLNDTLAETRDLIGGINKGHGTLGLITRDQAFAKKVDETVGRLQSILTQLNEGKGSAGKFLHDEAFYNDTDKLLVETRSLIQAVRQDPKKYLTINLKVF